MRTEFVYDSIDLQEMRNHRAQLTSSYVSVPRTVWEEIIARAIRDAEREEDGELRK